MTMTMTLKLISSAKVQMEALTGLLADSVTGISKVDSGWKMMINMLELKRIPPSTDVLVNFAADLDVEGNVTGFERSRSYLRNQIFSAES